MPAKLYRVRLEAEERENLEGQVSKGKSAARKLTRARILLLADEGEGRPGWQDAQIAEALGCHRSTVERTRQAWVEEGQEAALNHQKPSRSRPKVLDGAAEAQLFRLACSTPPEGREAWTLKLLADRLVLLGYVESVSAEPVRTTLKKTNSSPG